MVSKPQGSSERVLPWQITMDQLIFASRSHTHYWYEVGMLKVPAVSVPVDGSVQDARMGSHTCIEGYVLGIPVLLLCEARLMIRFILSSLPYTDHVKTVNAAASRASSSRLK